MLTVLPLTRELKRVLTRLTSLERAANSLGDVEFQRVKLASPATLARTRERAAAGTCARLSRRSLINPNVGSSVTQLAH